MAICDPSVLVYCDNLDCREEEQFEMTLLAGGSFDNRNLKRKMERLGWKTEGESVYCESCWEKRSGGESDG